MTDVTPDQKAKAKAAAANAAVACNDAAVVFGAAGVVAAGAGTATGVGAPAGVGVGIVLGLASFGAWFVGNRYQRLANDPPRTDYQTQTVSAASYVENQSNAEPLASFRAFSGEQLVLGDALSDLVDSLERYDGAVAASDTDSAESQAQAVVKNAAAATASIGRITALAATLNQNWSDNSASLDWTTATLDAARTLITDNCGQDVSAPAANLSDLLTRISGTDTTALLAPLSGQQNPLASATAIPDKPAALFSDAYLQAMQAASDALGALGVAPDVS